MARQFARSWCLDAELLGQAGWPGPVTLVVEKVPAIPDLATAGLPTVGLRVPATGVARALIEAAGQPIAAPSANRSEHVSPTTAAHVLDDLDGKVDIILDSGPTKMGIESAVIDLTGDSPRVLRPGPVRVEDLERVIGRPFDRTPVTAPDDRPGPAASPGQHLKHYAPRTPCLRVSTEAELLALEPNERDVVYAFQHIDDEAIVSAFASATHPVRAAAQLYATLRAMDDEGFDRILIVMPPDLPGWEAVRDRLQRASTPA
jgi:L-threonylcarbamoyladenylate synthase